MTGHKDPYVTAQQAARVVASVGDSSEEVAQVKEQLIRFGYLAPDGDAGPRDEYTRALERSLLLFQRYTHLPATGRLDVATLKLLSSRRCGVKDIPPEELDAALVDAGDPTTDPFTFRFNTRPWQNYNLTYRIYNGTPDVVNEVAIIDQAFGVWQAVSPLRFTRVTGAANINVGWETGDHGDGTPFDGAGSVVAHGFFPEHGGLHFDDAEGWNTTGGNVDLLNVAIHEIGHVLGLGHSRTTNAIMWPFVQNGRHNLGEEDIRGILSIYPFRVGSADIAATVHVWAFAGGTGSAVLDLGEARRFLAWSQVTFNDSLAQHDRDNAAAMDIFTVDANTPGWVGSGGDHLGGPGAPSNLFPGAMVGFGRRVQFRLSTMHSADLEAYGVGCVLVF
jgi:peptidoglycan hydrolase-like protein with peptidoglycan-binding domain